MVLGMGYPMLKTVEGRAGGAAYKNGRRMAGRRSI